IDAAAKTSPNARWRLFSFIVRSSLLTHHRNTQRQSRPLQSLDVRASGAPKRGTVQLARRSAVSGRAGRACSEGGGAGEAVLSEAGCTPLRADCCAVSHWIGMLTEDPVIHAAVNCIP